MTRKRRIIFAISVLLTVVGLLAYFFLTYQKKQPVTNSQDTQEPTGATVDTEAPEAFDKNMFAIDQPGSPWWVVNKKRPLPAGYVPPDLDVPDVRLRLGRTAPQMPFSKSAIPALKEMFDAAASEGVILVFGSGYRSEDLQRQFYSQYVAQDGQANADRYSARPGTSEHQTGLSFDATNITENCHLEICFQDTPEGIWLKNNAYKYGFIVRYPENKEDVTGYQYEPWHLRYVGRELAAELRRTGIQTLEEFFGLPSAASY